MSATIEAAEPPTLIVPKFEAIERGTVSQPLVSRFSEAFDPKTGFLAKYNVRREEEIVLLLIALLAGLDPLLLGPPGTGKTWLIELLLRVFNLPREALFNYMVFKESSADDVLGPRSLKALKEDRIMRMIRGFLPTAILAYLDEIFKCSPTMANSMLDLYAQRKVKIGTQVVDASQLLCIFHSSNELPDREDLGPFRDRIALTKKVDPVKAPDDRKRIYTIQDEIQAGEGALDMSGFTPLDINDLFRARAEVRRILFPDQTKEVFDKIVEQCEQKEIMPSARRQGQGMLAMKARAWSRGESAATTDDVVVLQHIFWNHPDHASDVHDIVMQFANVFARKASRMQEALEPILTELDRVKQEMGGGEPTDQHMEAAFKVMRDLRRMRKEAKEQIDQGEAAGHSTVDLERVLDEINQAHNWVEKTMVEDD